MDNRLGELDLVQRSTTWCPAAVQPRDDCSSVNPFGMDPTTYSEAYLGSLGTVGQAKTTSPRLSTMMRVAVRMMA